MVKKTKGKQVKQFKCFYPGEDLEMNEEVVKVYFKAAEGFFHIYHHEHISSIIEPLYKEMTNNQTIGVMFYNGELFGTQMQPVIDAYEASLKFYKQVLRNSLKSKVIRIQFRANSPHYNNNCQPFETVSFATAPTINLTYDVFWKVNDRLYHCDDDGRRLRDAGQSHHDPESCNHDGYYQIAWTEEREAFFEQIQGNMIKLIDKLEMFFRDIEGNTNQAIIAGGFEHLQLEYKEE